MVDVSNPFGNIRKHLTGAGGTHADQARKPREKVVSPTDGRVLRGKGKTACINYRVTPEFREALRIMASERGITMTELVDQAVALWKKANTGKHGGR